MEPENGAGAKRRPVFDEGEASTAGRDAKPPEAQGSFSRAWRGVHKLCLCRCEKSASYGNETHPPGGSREAPASLPAGGEGGRRPSFRGSGGWPQGEGSERRESALYRRWKVGVSDILLSLPGEGKEDVSLPSCLYSWSSP